MSLAPRIDKLDGFSAQSASFTILTSDIYHTIGMTTGASDKTVTIPLASENPGRILTLIKVDTGAGNAIFSRSGSDTIGGSTSKIVPMRNSQITLQSDGVSTWEIKSYTGLMKEQQALTFTSTPVGWSLSRANGIVYFDGGSVWRFRFNIIATAAAANTLSSTVVGVTFKSGVNQAVSSHNATTNTATQARAVTNSGTITVEHDTETNTAFSVSGDVELESKPTIA